MYKKIIIIIIAILLTVAIIYFCTYDKNTVKLQDISTDEELDKIEYNQTENLFSEDIIGILEIEKIGLKASIKQGSTSDILKEYIGHIEDTPRYDGNVGLAAHNRGNKYSYFARLNELENGDKVVYKNQYENKEYIVINKCVILETDWEMLKDTEDNRITMITCIKNKSNQRLCVQAVENNRKDDINV